MPGRKPWTTAHRAAVIEADLNRLRDEKHAAEHRLDEALHAEIRGMEQQYAAHADAQRCRDQIDVIDGQIDEQLEALNELPCQRRSEE